MDAELWSAVWAISGRAVLAASTIVAILSKFLELYVFITLSITVPRFWHLVTPYLNASAVPKIPAENTFLENLLRY